MSDITIRGGSLPPGRTARTIEVELHSTEPSAVEATRATVTQAPINAELLEKGGRFFLRGSYFALDACVVQGYVKRRIGNAFDEREVSIDEAFAITLRPNAGHQSDFVEVSWERGLGRAGRDNLLNGSWRREFLGQPRQPEPSPGPWTVKPYMEPTMRGGRERVFLVVDANGKTVASCDDQHQVDAYFIAGARDPAPPSANATDRARAFVNGFWGMVEKVPGGRGERLVEKLTELLGETK